jgi:tripartite-type tricarboxylate transporter receptor subunit TctC
MVAPFAPGGASDFIARMLAPKLSERLGQTVVVDNRSGAGGNIGFEIVVRAAADGYTLMIASSSYATNAAVTPKLSFDPIKDVTPISLVGVSPLVLVVHPSVAARSISELVALAKAQPGRLKFGSSGTGASPHLAGELFKVSAGINLLHIPYKGSGPALIDTLSGQIEMTFISMLVVRAHINAGRLRLLGVGTPQRSKALPDVPAIAETLPGFESTVHGHGTGAPAGHAGCKVEPGGQRVGEFSGSRRSSRQRYRRTQSALAGSHGQTRRRRDYAMESRGPTRRRAA